MIERHRAPDVVPQRRRVRPVAADRLERRGRHQRSAPADEDVLRPFRAGRPVARFTSTREHVFARRRGAGAGGEAFAVGRHLDVDRSELIRRRRVADGEGWRLGEKVPLA